MLAAGASLVKVGRELANAAVTPETRRREALLTADFATFLDAQGGNVPAAAFLAHHLVKRHMAAATVVTYAK